MRGRRESGAAEDRRRGNEDADGQKRCQGPPMCTHQLIPLNQSKLSLIESLLDSLEAHMAVGTVSYTSTSSPSPPLEAARALAPRIRALADWIEAERRLPDDLVQEIAGAGLFKVAVPREEGGSGADLLTVLRVVEEVARADGSTGWCVAMGVNTFRQAAQFRTDVRRELFYSDPVGVSAGSANPRGVARAVPEGYRVTGRWHFASGCMHSSSVHGACRVFEGDTPRLLPSGEQEVRIAYFYPKSVAEIVDVWSVSGMRGTGSHDIVVEDLFVPEERTFSAAERRARVTGPVNAIPGFDLAGCNFACVGLGVARAAIDALVELASAKTPHFSDALLRERTAVQAQVGEAEAVLRSGRAFLFEVAGGMWADAEAGRQITSPQRAELRLAMTHAAQCAARATHLMSVAAGTTSIFTSSPLERHLRDAEVVTRHVQLQYLNYESVGRTLLGLESTSPLF
jgi:alkylation response protein AidB-like acyl-CoA dehydrogenase